MSKELIIQKESSPLISKANELKIKTPQDMTQAVEVLSQLNKYLDKATEEKERVTKPLNEALKAERARWKPLETMYEQAISHIRSEMSVYQTKKAEAEKRKEQIIADKIQKGEIDIEKGIKKLETINKVATNISTENGSVKFKEVKRFEVVNIDLLPKEYLMPNEDMIKTSMECGNELPGVRYYTEQIPYNRR